MIFFFALIGIVFLFPLFLLIVSILMFYDIGNPFFFQKRVGRDGILFQIIKFRTMSYERDIFGKLLPDSNRLTSLGRFLRNSSLDEIPQLINVIKGDMSLVGPRPLLPNFSPLYGSFQKKRNEVKPGITGWAQVNGRNDIDTKKKFQYDVWYVDNISFSLDLKIIFITFLKIFRLEVINRKNQITPFHTEDDG